jgi:hypothetical protein
MAVMNRSMFQRPMPVVRRMAGSPKTGEEIYEDKGYDAYEYRADQAMDAENNQPSFFGKIFDNITDFFRFGRSDPESRLIIAGEYFDPEDPNFKMFIENNYMSDGDTYIEAIEKFKAFAESQKRSEGSSMQGEITASMYSELEGANDSPMIALKLAQKYGTPEEITIMEKIFPITRKVGPSTLSKNESNIIIEIIKKYSPMLGSDDLMHGISAIDDDGKLTEDYMTDRVIERREGSPKFGEMIKDGDFLARLLEYIDKMDIPQEEKGLRFREYLEEYGFPNFEEFFKEIKPSPKNDFENFFEKYFKNKDFEKEGIYENKPYIIYPDDPPFKPRPAEPYIIYPDDDPKIGVELLSRNQGSPMQGEQINVENVGIMDGFSGDGSEAEAMAIVEEGERAKNEIDGTSTYDELMQSIRGDNLTEADRRQELASYVGEKDAEETPDSVLTLVQPVMQMLDEGTANTGIGQIEEGREMATIAPTQQDAEEMMAMNMPQQPVGVANGGYMSSFPNQNLNTESLSASDNIDDRIMQNLQFERMAPGMMGYANGGQVQHFASGDLAEIQNTYNERLPLYMDIINNPERTKGNTLMDISQSFLNYGMGADPREALSYFLDRTGKRADQQAKTEQAIQMGALNAAIGKFDARELATLKMLSEQSKKNKTMVVGLTKERDTMIAKLLGLYKEVPTYGYQDPNLAGDEFSAGQVKDGTTKIIDYEKLYELYPNGTLNFSLIIILLNS